MALGCHASSVVPVSRWHHNRSANEIPWVEIEPNLWRLTTAGDIVRALRPSMLVPRDAGALHQVANPGTVDGRGIDVYVDDLWIGGREILEQIPALDVLNVRRLSSSEATLRYGTGHPNGVIVVTTHRNAAR
jgi:hypothetical protein